jgi:hypothetical protein
MCEKQFNAAKIIFAIKRPDVIFPRPGTGGLLLKADRKSFPMDTHGQPFHYVQAKNGTRAKYMPVTRMF